MTTTPVTRYHLVLRILHWTIGVLVLLQLGVGGLVLSEMPNDAAKLIPLTGHVSVGLSIGILMVLRLIVRLKSQKPPIATAGNPALNGLRKATHFLFYVVVFSMISTGVGVALMAGLFPTLFGAGGTLPENFHEFPPLEGHEVFATVLLVLVVLHVAGVLYHELALKDRLLTRMGFGKPRVGKTGGGVAGGNSRG
ncbi:MAG: cytochrome b/b6 domain-containing protein [Gammaproteobacteria bacterium]|nr:cytochrome b/b6 domain-containing protein [Gammaproteobacteria bacterium]